MRSMFYQVFESHQFMNQILYIKFYIMSKISNNIEHNQLFAVFEMENSGNFDSLLSSQRCLYCAQKDEMLKKYERLVLILKKRIRRCSSNSLHTFESINSNDSSKMIKQVINELVKEKENQFLSKQTKDQNYDSYRPSTTLSSVSNEYKLKDFNEQNFQKKYRLSQTNNLLRSAPSSFNFKINNQKYKKINLSTQWLQKFTQLNNKLQNKDLRIGFLSDEVYSLKNQLLYIRSVFIKLLRSLKLSNYRQNQKEKVIIDTQGKGIINLIIHLFEYSEQELRQIFSTAQNRNIKIIKDPNNQVFIDCNKDIYLPKFPINQMR